MSVFGNRDPTNPLSKTEPMQQVQQPQQAQTYQRPSAPQQTQQYTQAQPTPAVYYTRDMAQASIYVEQHPEIKQQLPQGAVPTKVDAATGSVQYMTAEQNTAWQSSVGFYTNLGHPEYAGKYDAIAVPQGYRVSAVKETTVLNPTDPLGKSKTLEFSFEKVGDTAVEAAFKKSELNTRFQSSPRSGTGAVGLGYSGGPTRGLSESEIVEYNQIREETIRAKQLNLGLFLASGAVAPALSPITIAGVAVPGAAVAAGAGIGISQIVKTGTVLYQGGEIKNSFLSGEELLQSAETGILFSGASKAVMAGVSKIPVIGQAIAPTTKQAVAAAKAASIPTKIGSATARIGINTGIGSAGGFALSGGKTEGAVQGAAFGAVFGVGGEAFNVISPRIAKMGVVQKISGRISDTRAFLTGEKQSIAQIEQLAREPLPRSAADVQIKNIETLTKEPLPRASESQLAKLEEISKEPLPRQSAESDAIISKIDRQNFDLNLVNKKIDAQIKQNGAFDINKANANIEKALREAASEKSAAKTKTTSEFKTGIVDSVPSNVKADYLIKQPVNTNLNLSEQIQIRNPNTFNISDASAKIDALLNKAPSKGNYDIYRTVISKGETMVATRTKSDQQLFRIEQLTKQPLPRTDTKLQPILQTSISTSKPITTAKTRADPFINSTQKTEQSNLTPKLNLGGVQQKYSQKMTAQFTGMDESTANLINRRLMPINAVLVSEKINTQVSGVRTSVSTSLAQKQNIGQLSKAKTGISLSQDQNQLQMINTKTATQQAQDQGQKQLQRTDQVQAQTVDTFIKTSSMSLPALGGQAMHHGVADFSFGKRPKIKSYKFVNPILTGAALLGAKDSGEEDVFGF